MKSFLSLVALVISSSCAPAAAEDAVEPPGRIERTDSPPTLTLRFAALAIGVTGQLPPAIYTLELWDSHNSVVARGTLRIDPLGSEPPPLPPVEPPVLPEPLPFDDPPPIASRPEPLTPIVIEAEDYVRFHHTSPGNDGRAYRTDDVDIERTSTAPGHCVAWWKAGEWLEYDFTVPGSGTCSITLSVGSPQPGGTIELILDGKAIATLTVPNTGGWHAWQHILALLSPGLSSSKGLLLSQGAHTLRIRGMRNSGHTGHIGNLDCIRIETTSE
ncbi:MAG: carbohydrate-binding protein [Opitutaceae bacterium]